MRSAVNSRVYDELGERRYTAKDDPVAARKREPMKSAAAACLLVFAVTALFPVRSAAESPVPPTSIRGSEHHLQAASRPVDFPRSYPQWKLAGDPSSVLTRVRAMLLTDRPDSKAFRIARFRGRNR